MISRMLIIVMSAFLAATGGAVAETGPNTVEERLVQARALLEAAVITHMEEDYQKAFIAFLSLAEEGNPEAEESVGRLYGLGYGVELDRCESTFWLDRAARAGRPWAQQMMGWSYWNADGVFRDHDLAYLWFMTAARNGRPDSAKDASILVQSDLRAPGRVDSLDKRLRTWRPEDQPPARIIRMPNIWGINWLMALSGLSPCHFQS